jgi:hypothetical protein
MAVEGTEDFAFDTAFAEALGGASTDEVTSAGSDSAPSDSSADGAPASTNPEGAEPVAATPSSAEGTAPAVPPAPAFSQSDFDAIRAELAELKKPKAEAPQAPVTEKPAEPQADVEFDKFAEEWPEVAKVMKAREEKIKAQYADQLKTLVDTVKQELLQTVQPVVASHQQSEEDRFLNTIKSQHPDAFDLLPEVEKWATTLPSYMKVGVDHALNKGTAEDVIALYNTFKKDTGRTTPAATTQPVVDEVTKKRLDKMKAVSASRPASPTAQADQNDFDGAFAQAVADIK